MSEDNKKKDLETNSNLFGLPILNSDNNDNTASSNLFGLPILNSDNSDNTSSSVGFSDGNEQNLRNMIFQLENEIRSGNITPYTCELYRQISQIATFDKIVLDSTIIKPADLTMLQEKVKEFETKQTQTSAVDNLNNLQNNNIKTQQLQAVEENYVSNKNDIDLASSTNNIKKEPFVKLTDMNNDQINELRKSYFEVRNDYVKSNQEYQEQQLNFSQNKDLSKST